MKTRRISLILFIALVVFVSAACDWGRDTSPTPVGTYDVDSIFQTFYNKLGGQSTLGPAISPLIIENGKYYQYTTASLMEYDSQAPPSRNIRLAPIGVGIGVRDRPQIHTENVGGQYVGGYQIYEKFVPLYNRLGGESVIGKPLAEVHKNILKERYEQYFENLGFYWIDGDTDDAVYLLAYGDWMCGQKCDDQSVRDGLIEVPTRFALPVREKAEELGLGFTGLALTEPTLADDGHVEQIYENVLMVLDLNTREVSLGRLPEPVGIAREAPNTPNPMPGMVFVPTEGNLGYNVPLLFDEYIRNYGGYEFIGKPITHVFRPDSETREQCFTNICLYERLGVDGRMQAVPVPVGVDLLKLLGEITVGSWEMYPILSPEQGQEIGIIVMNGGKPVKGAASDLTIWMPDGEVQTFQLPPTDENGETHLKLDPLMTESGMMIPYKACARLQDKQKFCVMDSFLVWELPLPSQLPPQTTSYLPIIMRNLQYYMPAFLNHYLTYMPFIGNDR